MLPGRDQARGRTSGRSGNRLRRGLVVGQVAMATALLVGSGLLARSLQRLGAVDLGLRTEDVVGLTLHGSAWYDLEPAAAQAQWDAVLDAVRAVPGVQVAGAIDYLPLTDSYSCDGFDPTDRPPPQQGEGRCVEVRTVLPGALEAMEIAIVRGRAIDDRDAADGPPVVVVDENAAEAFWPGEDPMGRTVEVHGRTHEVVGVAAVMHHFGPGGAVRPMAYLPVPQEGWNGSVRGLYLVVRMPEPGAVAPSMRRAVAGVNPAIAFGDPQPLDALLSKTLAVPRFRTLLMLAFATTALLLVVIGIAGVMMHSVTRRTRELGVRLALGAHPAEVRRLVLGEGSRLVVAGIVLGLIGALAGAGALRALLFGVSARDPLVYVTVTALLAGVSALACWIPARRASRVDPVTALNSE